MTTVLGRRAFIQQALRLSAIAMLAGCGPSTIGPPAGPRRIGFLSGNFSSSVLVNVELVRQTLRELDYVEHRDFVVEHKIAEGRNDRLPAMVAELIASHIDVLIAEAGPAQRAAQAATRTIPIVFTLQPDPVGAGLVASLARPGGNITGVSTQSREIAAKRVELLKETIPTLARVAVIFYSQNDTITLVLPTEQAARSLGVATETFGVRDAVELDAALETIAPKRFDGLVVLPTGSLMRDYRQVPDFAAKHRLPQIFSNIEIARAGGLMHVGPDYADVTRRATVLVDKILKGASPAELPVEQPTKFDFVINRSMARRIGLTIPDGVLRRATEVIP